MRAGLPKEPPEPYCKQHPITRLPLGQRAATTIGLMASAPWIAGCKLLPVDRFVNRLLDSAAAAAAAVGEYQRLVARLLKDAAADETAR